MAILMLRTHAVSPGGVAGGAAVSIGDKSLRSSPAEAGDWKGGVRDVSFMRAGFVSCGEGAAKRTNARPMVMGRKLQGGGVRFASALGLERLRGESTAVSFGTRRNRLSGAVDGLQVVS